MNGRSDDKAKIFNNGIKIQSNILKKIHKLSMINSADYVNIGQGYFEIHNEDKDKNLSNLYKDATVEKAVNISKINNFISIIGETCNSKTEYFTKKNNIHHVESYLREIYNDKYIVFTFKRSSIAKVFKKCLLFEDTKFSLELAFEIAKIAKFFLDNIEKSTLIFEMKTGFENNIAFYISCVLYYCKFFNSSLAAFESLTAYNLAKCTNKNTIMRYLRYFDTSLSMNSPIKFPQLILNQIILTSVPKISTDKDFEPILKIATKYNDRHISNQTFYKDNDFVIFSNLNYEVFDDTTISIYFEQEKKHYHILNLNFNTFFYKQGLYRFSLRDIETSLPQESIYNFFDENFCLDLVFVENNDVLMANPTKNSVNVLDTMKYIIERFFSDYDYNNSYVLRNKGYNKILATLCAQLHFNEEESYHLNSSLIESGHRSLNMKLQTPIIVEDSGGEDLKSSLISMSEPKKTQLIFIHSMMIKR